MNHRKQKLLLAALVLAAALFRLAFSGLVVGFDADIRGDEIDYHKLASNVAAGHGFVVSGDRPTGRRPPAWPIVLAGLYRITGPNPAAGRVLQVLLGSLVVWMTFAVARRYFSPREAWIASALVAVNPFLIFISGYLLTENLYMIVLLAALWVVPTPATFSGSWRPVALGALLLGIAALVRPTAIPVGGWMAASALVIGGGALTKRTSLVAMAVVITFLAILPWSLRNQQRFGGWVGLTTHGGITFYQGNNPRVVEVPHYRGGVAPLGALPHIDELSSMGELDRDREAYRLGKRFLRENVSQIPSLTFWKFVRFWRIRSDMGLSGIRSGWWFGKDSWLTRLAASLDVGFAYAVLVIPLFLAGVILTRRRWRDLFFLYGVVAAHTAVALVFFGSIRGRVPVEPVIAIFAAVALVRAFDWWRARGTS
jgi:4-amino-4-deoxy-L-arabinose transferase-like glycosyltransferase